MDNNTTPLQYLEIDPEVLTQTLHEFTDILLESKNEGTKTFVDGIEYIRNNMSHSELVFCTLSFMTQKAMEDIEIDNSTLN